MREYSGRCPQSAGLRVSERCSKTARGLRRDHSLEHAGDYLCLEGRSRTCLRERGSCKAVEDGVPDDPENRRGHARRGLPKRGPADRDGVRRADGFRPDHASGCPAYLVYGFDPVGKGGFASGGSASEEADAGTWRKRQFHRDEDGRYRSGGESGGQKPVLQLRAGLHVCQAYPGRRIACR